MQTYESKLPNIELVVKRIERNFEATQRQRYSDFEVDDYCKNNNKNT